jgi:hypothetical protein
MFVRFARFVAKIFIQPIITTSYVDNLPPAYDATLKRHIIQQQNEILNIDDSILVEIG